jgi:diguanylate cyclase (GGDEF)-like protein
MGLAEHPTPPMRLFWIAPPRAIAAMRRESELFVSIPDETHAPDLDSARARLESGVWDALVIHDGALTLADLPLLRNSLGGSANTVVLLLVESTAPAVCLCEWVNRLPGVRLLTRPIQPTAWDRLMSSLVLERSSGARVGPQEAQDWVQRELSRLTAQATIDPLTGLLRREEALRRAEEELTRARRTGHTLAFAMGDIDHFKRVNDVFGHQTGDRTLQRIAWLLNEGRRPYDLVGRMGGEEFLLVFPAVTLDQAGRIAERLRHDIQTHPWSHDRLPPVTVSFGVAEAQAGGFSELTSLTLAADAALYEAKRGGRNRVCTMIGPQATALRPPPSDAHDDRPCLLLVDDVRVYLDELSVLLGGRYRIAATGDPREALAWAEQRAFDLVLSDENMAGMKGHELLARLKNLQPDCVRFIMSSHGELTSAIRAINEGEVARYILKPWNDEELLLAIHQAIEQRCFVQRLRHCNRETIQAMAQAVELKDGRARGHSRRVGDLCARLAGELGYSRELQQRMEYAGWLHDVGKFGIPNHILHKQGRLTPAEEKIVREHPRLGADLVAKVEHLAPLAPIILHQHERYDGLGFPDGLAANDVPTESRLLALANDYDGLTHPACSDRSTATPDTALAQLRLGAGTLYDPHLVDVFERVVASAPATAA